MSFSTNEMIKCLIIVDGVSNYSWSFMTLMISETQVMIKNNLVWCQIKKLKLLITLIVDDVDIYVVSISLCQDVGAMV